MKATKIHLIHQPLRTLRGQVEVFRTRFEEREDLGNLEADFAKLLSEFLATCEKMQLQVSAIQIRRILEGVIPQLDAVASRAREIDEYESAWDSFARTLRELERVVEDEVSLKTYFELAPDQALMFAATSPFGDEVRTAFPSAIFDIEEASKCLALDRATASVFHLMRVVEVGLRCLGRTLNDEKLDPRRNPSWDAILNKCDRQLSLPIVDRCSEWRKDNTFFSDATANIRAIKNAWRNPTLHVEQSYDPERGIEVYNAVKGFMRHLARKLNEYELVDLQEPEL